METRPISGAPFGVEIVGFDPTRPITSADAAELKRLFDRHRLLLLRCGDVGDEGQVRLMSAIAPPTPEGASELLYSLNSTSRKKNTYIPGRTGLLYHSDYMFVPDGPIEAVSLQALVMDLPEPTSFCDSVEALKAMPPALVERLRDLKVVQVQSFSGNASNGVERASLKELSTFVPKEQLAVAAHPAIMRHPRTGEDVLLHSIMASSHFEGWTEEESRPLLDEIAAHQYRPEAIYEHMWQVGDLLLWDNIALQHGRRPLEGASERVLRRVAGNAITVHQLMAGIVPKDPLLRTPRRSAA